jgi:large subunit ribosomal protein L21
MYAVIRTGGKQQKVKPGDIIEIEVLKADGDSVTFQPLLVVDDEGTTHVGKEAEKATVTAKLLGEQKGDKVHIFKYKNKTGYSRRAGHRQTFTLVEISDIAMPAQRKSSSSKGSAKDSPAASKETDAKDAPAKDESPAEETAEA